jgi:hypothetical protein
MPLTYLYPTATELRAIEQDLLPVMMEDDPVFFSELFPTEDSDTDMLEWEQLDNFFGLQSARGLDGSPSPVARSGSNRYSTQPGYYGEYSVLDEQELTKRAKFASFTGTVDMTDLVLVEQRKLLQRRVDRIRWLGWTLLTTGQFNVASPNGGYQHRDRYLFDTLTASPAFSNPATATPFSFFLGLNTVGRGTSSQYGSAAKMYVNSVTVARILNNTNAADLGGRYRINGGDTVNDLKNVNLVLQARGLPQIVEYDKGYNTGPTAASFVPFIPNGTGVLVGSRPGGQPVGAYRMTLNANNDFKPGPYTQVIDNAGRAVPRKVEVHDGHNGGPVVFFGSAIKILNLG